MKIYDGKSKCPKCGAGPIWGKYCPPQGALENLMKLPCPCGYWWFEHPRDHTEEDEKFGIVSTGGPKE